MTLYAQRLYGLSLPGLDSLPQGVQDAIASGQARVEDYIQQQSEQAGTTAGQAAAISARNELKRSVVPWIVGGGVVLLAVFFALRGRK